MPLRDHFRPPVSRRRSWEEIHAMWPAVIVQQLRTQLPAGYESGPKVHSGARIEVDIATDETDEIQNQFADVHLGHATAIASSFRAEPSLVVETEIPDDDEYEVRIYDADRDRMLVAVIELVSPANKDRPDKRNAFVSKCAALLRQGISVSIVDVVTTRQHNLYAELLDFLRIQDPTIPTESPAIYAATCRWFIGERRARLETWTHTLHVGEPLPLLPLWLSNILAIPLELEQSYEKTCADLNIR